MILNAPAHLIQTWNKLYFDRLGFRPKGKPSLEQLNQLILAHQLSIPFENVDIQLGNQLDLSLPVLRKKILLDKRGGFCYELNHLFASFLRHLGYKLRLISAQVMDQQGRLGKEHDHLAILVELNEKMYLVDVGFGKFAPEALLVQDGITCLTYDGDDAYQVELRGSFGLIASRSDLEKESKEFKTVYTFSTEAKVIEDFFSMFNYHQSSEQSHFVEKLLISIRTKNGRKSISKNKLIITEKGSKQLITLKNAHDFREVLSSHFGILISENQAVLLSSAKR
ncbi:MAG: arylamine N-acetyltransferase [Flavobacteriales bacterium]|nr:arylamine N-acetyltransferase [Flavobacteriales bacterium]